MYIYIYIYIYTFFFVSFLSWGIWGRSESSRGFLHPTRPPHGPFASGPRELKERPLKGPLGFSRGFMRDP